MCCFGQFAPDSIRIAHIQWADMDMPIPQQFLIKAKAMGYNYVLCEYGPYWAEWNHTGKIIAARPTLFEKRMTQHFQQVDSAGLRLIPNLTTSTQHADWEYGVCIDTLIPRQHIHQNLPIGYATSHIESFVMSPDSTNAGANRMNNDFDTLWTMVFNAFNNAKSTMKYKNLDFVHLGYDENVVYDTAAPRWVPLVGLCPSDTAWLRAQGLKGSGTQTQLQWLYAANIKKRVSHITSIASKKSGSTTKAILWGDMFDPILYYPAMYSFKNLFDTSLINNNKKYKGCMPDSMVKVSLVGALNLADMQSVKDNVIFGPWVYDTVAWGGRYYPKTVIDTFTTHGFKVVNVCTGAFFGGYDKHNNPIYDAFTENKYKNAFEFAIAAHDGKFNSKSIGYVCVDYSNLPAVVARQNGNLIWNADSNYIKPFDFMGILTRINYRRTSDSFR
jgi:hypothetical protein